MKKLTNGSSIVVAMLLFAGCGGGSSTPSTQTGTGFYVDANISGVDYECGSQIGKTDKQGKFIFEQDKGCTFKIGDVVLRTVEATLLKDNITILEDNPNVAQLLQSLDSDGNAENGIDILPETAGVLKDESVTEVPTQESDIEDIRTSLASKTPDYNGRFVPQGEAVQHVQNTAQNLRDNNSSTQLNNNSNMGNMTPTSTTLKNFNYVPYSKPLAVPALASYTVVDGVKVFNLDINESTTNFFEGIATKTYGINSSILGQTIRIHNGEAVKLTYNNNLSVATTIHGHGMHVPAIMDGGPVNKIQPNSSWSAEYTVKQKACTNWYHPHFMHKTAEHVYMGLAGFIIIDDDESDALNLPKEYGVDDIPVALQDKRFDTNGQIDYSPTQMEVRMGYKSDVMLANGVINPYVDVPAKKVRFRLLNGSNSRVYNIKFSDGRAFQQIATDNAFLEAPVVLNSVSLTPGERAEIVVDFSSDMNKSLLLTDSNSNLDIMKINVNKVATTSSDVPTTLTTLTKLDPANAVRTRKFMLNMARGEDGAMHMAINGKLMSMMRIDEVVPVNDIEIWEITNMMGMEHNFHIHATHFFPLERNGQAVNANEQGYKDVIRLAGRDTVKVIVQQTDFVDDSTGYMYHCHFLEHEDDGMMGQFTVTNGEAIVNVGGTSGGMSGGRNGNGMGRN